MAASISEKTPMTIIDAKNPVSREIKKLSSAICGEPEIKDNFFIRLIPKSMMGREKVNRECLRQNFYESQL